MNRYHTRATIFLLLFTGKFFLCNGFSLRTLTTTTTTTSSWALGAESSFPSSSSSLSFDPQPSGRRQQKRQLEEIFPVLSRIQGINWQGPCRYVNGNLQPQTNLRLTGGTRYDLKLDDNDDKDPTKATCTLTSFLVFPNGKSRQVQMKGQRRSLEQPSMRLDAVEGGPIYMVLTELPPDTVLLNEVDKASGKIILTSSLSIPSSSTAMGGIDELIQISHEVKSDGDKDNKDVPIVEGHQVWRLKRLPTSESMPPSEKEEDFPSDEDLFRATTGR